jgi:hypothetical protein
MIYRGMDCEVIFREDLCSAISTCVFSHGQGRIYARATGALAQGGILKKSRLKYGMRIKKRLSTREKFKGDLY